MLLSLSIALPVCQATESAGQAEPSLVDFSLEQLGDIVQRVRTALLPGSRDASGLATNDPSYYWSLRSSHDLAADVQADFLLRRVGSLPRPALPAYSELDLRMAWQPSRRLDLSMTGQNLLHRCHPEPGAPGARQLIERAVQVKMVLRF
ncbi:MAG: hypothetical protein V4693_16345 [Pseudomonadota bacterium]